MFVRHLQNREFLSLSDVFQTISLFSLSRYFSLKVVIYLFIDLAYFLAYAFVEFEARITLIRFIRLFGCFSSVKVYTHYVLVCFFSAVLVRRDVYVYRGRYVRVAHYI